MILVALAAVMMGCGVDERERFGMFGCIGWCRDAIEEKAEELRVSIGMSSLVLVEPPRGKPGGGGVRICSSKLFQNAAPEELRVA